MPRRSARLAAKARVNYRAMAGGLAPRRRRAARAPRAGSAFTKKVVAIINRKQETKYVAESITVVPGGPASVQVPSAQVTPINLQRLIPEVAQGLQEDQRVGDSIQPTRINSYFTLFLSDFTTQVIDCTVNIVIVYVKGASSQPAVQGIPGGDFLKTGGGGNTDPNGFTPTQFLTEINRYQVNSDQYTLKKWFRRRFCKGAGPVQGAAAVGNSAPTAGQGAVVIKYSWKPPKLKYNAAADLLPTNHYPVYLIWATSNNGTALTGDLAYNLRSEMFYKDA